MNAVRPVVAPPIVSNHSFNAPHYGVLMGGAKEIKIEGVGDQFTGHLSIPRRTLAEFTHIKVGRSYETEFSLNEEVTRPGDWAKDPRRLVTKSPGQCARDVYTVFGDRGFVIPMSLVGKDYDEAASLFERVMPKSDNLVDIIKELSAKTFENADEEQLRQELLNGAAVSQEYVRRYLAEIKTEVSNAQKTGRGKSTFDSLDEEYFRELKEPLPEERPALATLSLGKEIAASLNAAKSSSTTDELLRAVLEQNQLLMKQLESSRQAPPEVTEPVKPKGKAVSNN